MAGSAIPMSGALYSDFGGLGIPAGILATCHLITT